MTTKIRTEKECCMENRTLKGVDYLKRVLIIVISIILICLTGLGAIGYIVEQKEEKNQSNIEQNIEQNKQEKVTGAVLDVNALDINKIEGYTPGGQAVESSEEQKLEENQETETKVGGLTLPFTVPYRELDILSIGGYSGKFVEDGSDAKKTDLLSMVIKNTSEETISYGKIVFKIPGENMGIVFQFSNLKPGASALVLESTGKIKYSEDNKYIYLDSKVEMDDEMSLMKKDVKISAKEKEITVENLSESNLNTVYVYYKTVDKGGCYLGGITYRTKFEKVTAKKTISNETIHFLPKNSEIIMVESIKE